MKKSIKNLAVKSIENTTAIKGGSLGRGDKVGGGPSNKAELL